MRGTIYLHFRNNVLQKIDGRVEFYYSLGNLVEQFGGPEGIWLSEGGPCSSCEGWKPPEPLGAPVQSLSTHLLYPSQGLWFLVLVPVDGTGCLCPEMKVAAFCYYAPLSMHEALTDNYLANLCSSSLKGVTEEDLVEWHGFGGGY
jgi:hypothetical protein